MQLPKIRNYGKYSSGNYGAHTLCISIGRFDFYYSYDTVVAFSSPNHGLCLSENVWGITTGKHLNMIGDYSYRIPHEEFQQKLWDTLDVMEFDPDDVVELPLNYDAQAH